MNHASARSRTTRSLWFTLLNLAVVLSAWGWATKAIAQIYQVGDAGSAVTAIQQRLGILADGVYGSETATAVSNFQQSYGLGVDGVAGPETLRALNLNDLVDGNSAQQLPLNSSRVSAQSYLAPPVVARLNAIAAANPYVVVIPGSNAVELLQARRFSPQADLSRSRRGEFIRAGMFQRRSEAERLSRELRQAGLDARVAYRP